VRPEKLLNSPDLLGWLFAAFLIAAGLFIMLPQARSLPRRCGHLWGAGLPG
jgi:hypothetical protein